MERQHVIDMPVNTASELLDALSGRSAFWKSNPDAWIHRGQSDSRMKLIPSALRSTVSQGGLGPFANGLFETNFEQVNNEFLAVWQFVEEADKRGLPIPEGNIFWRSQDDETEILGRFQALLKRDKKFPPSSSFAAFGLAQHYGVQTRFLDWSSSPLVAAYFASVNCVQQLYDRDVKGDGKVEVPDRFSVWSLNTRFVVGHCKTEGGYDISLSYPPRAGNPNLAAQKGVLSVFRPVTELDEAPAPIPLEDVIENQAKAVFFREIVRDAATKPPMYHFHVPVVEAPNLLQFLDWEDINGSSLFPGYAGISKLSYEREMVDKLKHIGG